MTPWIVYFGDVANSVSIFLAILGLIIGIAIIGISIGYQDSYSEEVKESELKTITKLFYVLLIIGIINVLIPSKEAIYKMWESM